MNKLKFAIVLSGLIACVSSSVAGELYVYEHNLSVINWAVVGDKIVATYATPKPSLRAAGVKEEDILFKGVYDGDRIVGKAYAFKSGCSPAPYDVIGHATNDGYELRGPGPVRSKSGCDVIGYSAKSPHAVLRFTYSATHH